MLGLLTDIDQKLDLSVMQTCLKDMIRDNVDDLEASAIEDVLNKIKSTNKEHVLLDSLFELNRLLAYYHWVITQVRDANHEVLSAVLKKELE